MIVNSSNQSFGAKFTPSSSLLPYTKKASNLEAMKDAASGIGEPTDILVGITQMHDGAHAHGASYPGYPELTLCLLNSKGEFIKEKTSAILWGAVERIIEAIKGFNG